MKKILPILFGASLLATSGFAQMTKAAKAKLEAEIIRLDKLAWQAWKDRNAEWFKTHTTEEFLSISSEGVSTKADVIKATPTECDVKNFALANFKFVVLDQNTVILSYTATQDATCSGKKVSPKIRAAVTYVKRAGKWIEAFYIETPMAE
ncbi:MAG: nuclear transport factor 2 family protein [Chitinophagaceae bacterium]